MRKINDIFKPAVCHNQQITLSHLPRQLVPSALVGVGREESPPPKHKTRSQAEGDLMARLQSLDFAEVSGH